MTTRTVDQWLITAPQPTFEAILAVTAERSHQEDKGWTPEHDMAEGIGHLVEHAEGYLLNAADDSRTPEDIRWSRDHLVKAAALIVAAIEVIDRG